VAISGAKYSMILSGAYSSHLVSIHNVRLEIKNETQLVPLKQTFWTNVCRRFHCSDSLPILVFQAS